VRGPDRSDGGLGLGLCLDSDATVGDDGGVVGDPTEAALVVLAAKLGVDAEETRRAYPRVAEVPFDSDYKFMATFHELTIEGRTHVIELVKGGPDVVLARCTQAGGPMAHEQVPIAEARAEIDQATRAWGSRVCASWRSRRGFSTWARRRGLRRT
jgi:Ca2+-transporting ATPase